MFRQSGPAVYVYLPANIYKYISSHIVKTTIIPGYICTGQPFVKTIFVPGYICTVQPCVKTTFIPGYICTVQPCVKTTFIPGCICTVQPCVKTTFIPGCICTVQPCVKTTFSRLRFCDNVSTFLPRNCFTFLPKKFICQDQGICPDLGLFTNKVYCKNKPNAAEAKYFYYSQKVMILGYGPVNGDHLKINSVLKQNVNL